MICISYAYKKDLHNDDTQSGLNVMYNVVKGFFFFFNSIDLYTHTISIQMIIKITWSKVSRCETKQPVLILNFMQFLFFFHLLISIAHFFSL